MFTVIKEVNGHFEADEHFNTFADAARYLKKVGDWGRWIVPEAIARMLDGRSVSDLNFRHYYRNGHLGWYADPVYRAKLVFEKLTGIKLELEEGEGILPRIKGTPVEVSIDPDSDGCVSIDVYLVEGNSVEAKLHVDVYPECVTAFWSDKGGVTHSPPEELPDPEFFRAFLRLPESGSKL